MKLKIYAVNDENNIEKLESYGADVIDVIPQDKESSAYLVDVEDENVDDLSVALFGTPAEDAEAMGLIEMNANIEEEQKRAEQEAVDEAADMVDEARDIIEASDTAVWDATDDFMADPESDIEVVDTTAGKLLLSDGYVLGYVHQEQAKASVVDLFANNEALADTIKTALLAESNVDEAFESFGFEPYTVELNNSEEAELAAKSRVNALKAGYNKKVESLKASLEQSLAMALLSVTKGLEGPCSIKSSIVDALDESGAENSEEFVEETLAKAIPEFTKQVCAKTYEFMEKPLIVRNELAKTLEAAAYARPEKTFAHVPVSEE